MGAREERVEGGGVAEEEEFGEGGGEEGGKERGGGGCGGGCGGWRECRHRRLGEERGRGWVWLVAMGSEGHAESSRGGYARGRGCAIVGNT